MRRSREARRLKENQIALRAAFLEKENKILKRVRTWKHRGERQARGRRGMGRSWRAEGGMGEAGKGQKAGQEGQGMQHKGAGDEVGGQKGRRAE